MMDISFKLYKNSVSEDGKYIRKTVFIDEQDVTPEEEFDGSDKYSENIVMYVDGSPAATGRITVGERGECMIGRIACLKEYRGKGLGKVLMQKLISRAKEKGFDTVYVNAQVRVRGFYESLDFKAFGDIFMDANIVHIAMKKSLY